MTRWRKEAPWEPIPEGMKGRPTKPPLPAADDLVSVFARNLYLPDPEPVYVVAGAVAANLLAGDPAWLLVVAPPSSGKTELVWPLRDLPWCHVLSDTTEAGLLSGGTRRRDGSSTGGVLREMGDFGIVVVKDLSAVLASMDRADSPLAGALREVYDGNFVRRLGTDGGTVFTWSGKAGFVGAVTETIDLAMSTLDAMGPRFIYYRLPDPPDEDEMCDVASANRGRQPEMRAELASAVQAFFRLRPLEPPTVDPDTTRRIRNLARFCARARSVVHRDSHRDIEAVPRAERGPRLMNELAQLHAGMLAIGVPAAAAYSAVRKVGLDSMPHDRYRVLANVAERRWPSTANVADNLGLPEVTVRRHLEDLTAHQVLTRSAGPGVGDIWHMSPWAAERWSVITGLGGPAPDDSTGEADGSALACSVCGFACDPDLNPHPGCVGTGGAF